MLFRIAAFASLAGFLYGYDEGLIGGASLAFSRDLGLSEAVVGACVGAAKAGAVVGAAAGGAMMESGGRVSALRWLVATSFVAGPLAMSLARGAAALVFGRLVVGLGIGGAAVVVPAYLGEVSPARKRGRIVELFEVALALGMLVAVLADAALQRGDEGPRWRVMVGLPVLPALLLALGSFFLPESPRWLVVRGRLDEALAVIHRVVTNERADVPTSATTAATTPPPLTTTAEVERELLDLWSAVEKERAAVAEEAEEERRRRGGGGAALLGSTRGGGGGAALLGSTRGGGGGGLPSSSSWQQLELASTVRRPSPPPQVAPAAAASSVLLRPVVESRYGEFEDEFGAVDDDDEGDGEEERDGDERGDGGDGGGAPPIDPRPSSPPLDPGTFQEISRVSPPGLPKIKTRPRGERGGADEKERREEERGGKRGNDSSPCSSSSPSPGSPAAEERARKRREKAAEATRKEHASLSVGATPTDDAIATAPPPPPPRETRKRRAPPASSFPGFWRQLSKTLADVGAVARGPERRAFWLLVAVAAANQGMGSSAVVTYSPALLKRSGVQSDAAATALAGAVSGAKLLGVAAALLLVDAAGRRPLATLGGAACSLSLVAVAVADSLRPPRPALLLSASAAFVAAFSTSHAGLFWVLSSELFSMRAKAAAATAATAALFASGAAVNVAFLPAHSALGGGVAFGFFAAVAAAVALLCYFELPETKGKTLAEVVEAMKKGGDGGGRRPESPRWRWPAFGRGRRYARFDAAGGSPRGQGTRGET